MVDLSSIRKHLVLADKLFNVSVLMDSERFHVLHLGKLRQNEHYKLVEHQIIDILDKQICVTSNIVERMILLVMEVMEHTT